LRFFNLTELQPTPRAIQNAAAGQNDFIRNDHREQVLNFDTTTDDEPLDIAFGRQLSPIDT